MVTSTRLYEERHEDQAHEEVDVEGNADAAGDEAVELQNKVKKRKRKVCFVLCVHVFSCTPN